LKPALEPVGSERYELLLTHTNGGVLLDFGCGFGKLADQLKFYFDEVRGVEIDPYCAEWAERVYGIRVYNDFIERLNFEDEYDACLSYNNIEHLYNPGEVLRCLHKSLRRNGIIYIECPNIESLSIKCFDGRHHLLESNEHINMFQVSTLTHLLEDAGFFVLNCGSRKPDTLFNDLVTYWLRRKSFYHRCSSPFFSGTAYKDLCHRMDRLLAKLFRRLNRRNARAAGAYLQVVARKT
jgi:SAM-dependent methyltransferase